jgi:hypothetical protein
MNYQKNYYPRRPVKSFQDLEVYQKLLAISVAVAKRIPLPKSPDVDGKIPADVIHRCVLNLPLTIAEAHSIRFSAPQVAIEKLEKVMLDCNILIVYLEQYRDIENKDIEPEFFEEQIKNILATRMKILHLQFSWKKFSEQRKKEQNV